MMEFFETHAHYDTPEYDADRTAILRSVSHFGVSHILNVSYDMESSERSIALAEEYPGILAAVGVHPQYLREFDDAARARLQELVKHPAVAAIGECGPDFYEEKNRKSSEADFAAERERQQEVFCFQLELAAQTGLPVVVHSRAAAQDTLQMLRKYSMVHGVMHGFSYSAEIAAECVKLGWYIGIGPVLTRPGARKIREVVERVPIDRLLIETDCPFQTTESCRGRLGDSRMLAEISAGIAQIKGISTEEVAEIITENSLELFSCKTPVGLIK